MPYPNFHAARVNDPDKYTNFAYKNIANGIDIVLGIRMVDGEKKSETQAYRFSKKLFTVDEAKAWLKEHDISYISFEPAKETEAREDDGEENFFPIQMREDFGNEDTDLLISGVAVSTDIVKRGRLPYDLLKADSSLVGKPLIDWHSKFGSFFGGGGIRNNDIFGKIIEQEFIDEGIYSDGPLAGQKKGRVEFVAKIWDGKAKRVVEEFPEICKFSVGFKANSEPESFKIKSDSGEEKLDIQRFTSLKFDHLGLLSRPADKRAKLTKRDDDMDENEVQVLVEGKLKVQAEEFAGKMKLLQDENESLKREKESTEAKMTEMVKSIESLTARQKAMEDEKKKAEISAYVDGLVEKGIIAPKVREETINHYMTLTDAQMTAQRSINSAAAALNGIFDEAGEAAPPEGEETPEPVKGIRMS